MTNAFKKGDRPGPSPLLRRCSGFVPVPPARGEGAWAGARKALGECVRAGLPLLFASLLGAYEDVALDRTVDVGRRPPNPVSVALAEDGRIFVGDRSGGVSVFGPDGRRQAEWAGQGDDRPRSAAALAIGQDGSLYVADPARDAVSVWSPDGKSVRTLAAEGTRPGEVKGPSALAVSPAGELWVAEEGNRRVQVFSPGGFLLETFPLPEGRTPHGLAVLPDGSRWLADESRGALELLDRGGRSKALKQAGKIRGLAGDGRGTLVLGDRESRRIRVWNAAGQEEGQFGSPGSGPGQFKTLTALAAAPGRVAVLDAALSRVQIFRIDPAPPPVAGRAASRLSPVLLESRPGTAEGLAFARGELRVLRKGAVDPGLTGVRGLAIQGERIYAAEPARRRLGLYDLEGRPLGALGVDAKGTGRLRDPQAVAVDGGGRVFFIDGKGAEVPAFSPDGVPLAALGGGRLKRASALAGLARGVVVADPARRAVTALDDRGRLLWESTGPWTEPAAVAVDGPVTYVLDVAESRVSALIEGRLIGRFGSSAHFSRPLVLAAAEGRVAVGGEERTVLLDPGIRPAPPAGFSGAGAEGAVRLAWRADSEGLTDDWALSRSTGARAEEPWLVLPATATGRLDDGIIPGTTYHYTLTPRSRRGGTERAGSPARISVWTARPANLPPVEIAELSGVPLFAAAYKSYAGRPLGRAAVKNNTERTYRKLRVGFMIRDFMDFPTETEIDRLEPGERRALDLSAVFNNRILSVSEDTPVQAELTVTYFEEGEEKTAQRREPWTLHSRNALLWAEPRRLAAFVTPKDPPVVDFARGVLAEARPALARARVDPALAQAAALHAALGAAGLAYVKDPRVSFEQAKSSGALDYVQYPRETLKRKAGDCDDLTALYASLLESVGVSVRIADLPGHVLALVLAESAPVLPPERVVRRDEEIWIPVETTALGAGFEEAWREGARAWRGAGDRAQSWSPAQAWAEYPPATLAEGEGTPAPRGEAYAEPLAAALAAMETRFLESAAAPLLEKARTDPKDESSRLALGLLYADYARWTEAGAAFDELLALRPNHAAALNNRANVHLTAGEAAQALPLYEKAAALDPADGGIRLNLARAAWRAGDKAAAETAWREALKAEPGLAKDFGSLEEVVR